MRIVDRGRFGLRFGSWMDTADGELPVAVEINISGSSLPEPEEITQRLLDWNWNPWAFELHRRAYFANASGEFTDLVMSVGPLLRDGILVGSLAAIATKIIDRLFALFTSDGYGTDVTTLERASEVAIHWLASNVGLAQPDIRELSSEVRVDGSYVFIFEDQRRKQSHLVVVTRRGITAHANLDALKAFVEKWQGSQDNQTAL